MNLQIITSQVSDLQINKKSSKSKSFDLEYRINYLVDDDSAFAVIFNIEIISEQFALNMEYVTWFKTSEPINEEFKSSHFPIINAPAIAFPFLRSYISNLTLNSGYPPVMLPSVNFVKMSEENPPLIEG